MNKRIIKLTKLKLHSSLLSHPIDFFESEFFLKNYPPASEASREGANLTERKNPHTPLYGVKEFVCLPVCLLPNSTPIISGLAEQNGMKFFWGISGKNGNFTRDLSSNQNQKRFEKKLAGLAARAVFVGSFYKSLDLHHSQGGMKFATQISPLLNLFIVFMPKVPQKVK